MQKAVLLLIGFIYGAVCFGQKQKTLTKVTATYRLKQTTSYYKLGSRNIGVVTYRYNNNPNIVMINVHDDEATSIEVSKQVLRKTGGYLIKINNDSTRLISFKLNGTIYKFDPNRMFTEKGIAASLHTYGTYSLPAAAKIKGFANFVLAKIPKSNAPLIALHNNHRGDYSINTYENDGGQSSDSRAIYIDSIRATDDFFLTTDEIIYNKIRSFGYNVTLQNNLVAADDGSLSIYCGHKNKGYVNVETEHGKPEVQFNMLMTVINTPKRILPNSYICNYEMEEPVDEKSIKNLKIYFSNKQVGNLISAYYAQSYKKTIGQLEIDNNYQIYSNADLFLLLKKTGAEMELRIDPTRERKSFDRLKETINVYVRD